MSGDGSKQLQVDTNIFMHAVRGSATWQQIRSRFDLLMAEPIACYSVVTQGDILSLAAQRGWDDVRRNQMLFLFSYFRRIEIGTPEILAAYAEIDVYSLRRGI